MLVNTERNPMPASNDNIRGQNADVMHEVGVSNINLCDDKDNAPKL